MTFSRLLAGADPASLLAMRRRRPRARPSSVARLCAACVLASLVACTSSDGSPPSANATGTAASAIVHGQVDTTHRAVVAVLLGSGSESGTCSGTVVKIDVTTGVGWVATAAHCVVELPPTLVLEGDDYSRPGALRHEVIDYRAHPLYDRAGSPYDVAVIRIAGVDAATPVVPLGSAADGLVGEADVVSVGYGRTTLIATGPDSSNTTRRSVVGKLFEVDTFLAYGMQSGGFCQGDSGGPLLAPSAGAEKVVGIHSYVQADCNGLGYSTRVSFLLPFLQEELAKEAVTVDCQLCRKTSVSGAGTCASAMARCVADAPCSDFAACIGEGKSPAACRSRSPRGEGPYDAAASCWCSSACPGVCGADPVCAATPTCGAKLEAGACGACAESSCCAEALDCARDATCFACLANGDTDASCASNASRTALATCAASKCPAPCEGSALTAPVAPAPAEPAPDPPAPADPSRSSAASSCSVPVGYSASHAVGGGVLVEAATTIALLAWCRRRRAAG